MSELTLVGIRQKSKARILGVFKPRELVVGEPFELHLTFRNDGTEVFPGGTCRFHTEEGRAYSLFNYSIEIRPIKPTETRTIVFRNMFIKVPGYAAIIGLTVTDNDENEVFTQGDDVYSLSNASREELYQKYSVTVALLFSTLATILTIVNVLVSLLL